MMGRSHLALTAAGYVALSVHPLVTPLGRVQAPQLSGSWPGFGQTSVVAAIGVGAALAAVTSLSADIDKPGSRASRAFGWPSYVLSWIIRVLAGHRGITHSVWPAIGLALLGSALGALIGVHGLGQVLAFGYGGALLLDAWTAAGIVPLYPLPWRLRIPPGFRVGGRGEVAILASSLGLCIWWALGAPDLVHLARTLNA
jgi:membrane-bound metal-dependent hydrolase YbcI (DUF457 family)